MLLSDDQVSRQHQILKPWQKNGLLYTMIRKEFDNEKKTSPSRSNSVLNKPYAKWCISRENIRNIFWAVLQEHNSYVEH